MAGTTLHEDGGPNGRQQPRWFTPIRLLVIFCAINMLNYLDRGVIASNGVNGAPAEAGCIEPETCKGYGIQGDFGLSYFQDGFLASAFMVGLLVASPIFAHLSKTVNPFRLIGVGLTVWTIATAGCGFSVGFLTITACRMFVGVGEASFVSLAAPFILDSAPPGQSSAWLAIFYMCIPVGTALGYVFGGVVGGWLGWRFAFWIESLLMLPFAVFGFMSNRLHLKGIGSLGEGEIISQSDMETSGLPIEDEVGADVHQPLSGDESMTKTKFPRVAVSEQVNSLLEDCKELALDSVYSTNVLGYITYTFVLGAYAYWGPKAGQAIFHMENADLVFGVVTILSGILGTLFGGLYLDYLGSTLRNAFKLLAVATALGATGCLLAFLSQSLVFFIPLFAIGEFFLFATQGPVNFVTLQSVSPILRPLAMAFSTVFIHVFGDVPSAPIVGAVQDQLQNWRLTTLLLTSIFYLSMLIWGLGAYCLPLDEGRCLEVNSSDGQRGKSHKALLLADE